MIHCKNCSSVFEETELESTLRRDTDTNYDYRVHICPFCHSDDLKDAFECKGCGEAHPFDDLTEGFCKECEKKLQDKVTEFFKQFNEDEKNYIFESGILEDI